MLEWELEHDDYEKFYHAGLINAPYSCRDFRYYFSIHDFEKTMTFTALAKFWVTIIFKQHRIICGGWG
ncbi:hypothetical protein AGMMS49944_11530 [Spirochaetia bacterium]|nr:hypothetical protein AGMMS49944_11530 [Spirochaetia bacterium]